MYSFHWSWVFAALLGTFLFAFVFIPLFLWGISITQYPRNRSFMDEAKKRLQGNWDRPVAAVAIFFGIMIFVGSIEQIITVSVGEFSAFTGPMPGLFWWVTPMLTSSTLLWLVRTAVQGALSLGLALFFLRFTRNEGAEIDDLFHPFRNMNSFLYSAGTQLLIALLVFLWSLLFIIPGIVAALSYSMALYILADEPNLTPPEVLRKSRTMMKGYRLEYFWLGCRFIGWGILAMFSMGIGFLWLLPYFNVASALFYRRISGDYESSRLSEQKIPSGAGEIS